MTEYTINNTTYIYDENEPLSENNLPEHTRMLKMQNNIETYVFNGKKYIYNPDQDISRDNLPEYSRVYMANNPPLVGKEGYYETGYPQDRFWGGISEIEGIGTYLYDVLSREGIKDSTIKIIEDFQNSEIAKLNASLLYDSIFYPNEISDYDIGNLHRHPGTKGIGRWGIARDDLRPLTPEDYTYSAEQTLENIKDTKYYTWDNRIGQGGGIQMGRYSFGKYDHDKRSDDPDTTFMWKHDDTLDMIKTIAHEVGGHGTGLTHGPDSPGITSHDESYDILTESLYGLLNEGQLDTLSRYIKEPGFHQRMIEEDPEYLKRSRSK
jgi:hypothetical protein